MADCEFLEKCPFFNDQMKDMPAMAKTLKNRYCRADFDQCARYTIATKLGRGHVPPDMFPSEMERALGMLPGS